MMMKDDELIFTANLSFTHTQKHNGHWNKKLFSMFCHSFFLKSYGYLDLNEKQQAYLCMWNEMKLFQLTTTKVDNWLVGWLKERRKKEIVTEILKTFFH